MVTTRETGLLSTNVKVLIDSIEANAGDYFLLADGVRFSKERSINDAGNFIDGWAKVEHRQC